MSFDIAQLKKINQLDFEQIASWPFEVKIVMAMVLTTLSLGLGWSTFISPKLPILSQTKQAEITLKREFSAKYRITVNLPRHKIQLEQLERDFTFMLKSLPTSNETPGLLNDITYLGTTSGLSFKLLQWLPEIEKEFYAELPIKLDVTGHYHDFGEFVTKIATLPRIVTLHDFTITHDTGGLRLQMQAKTYRTASKTEANTL